MKKLLLLLLPCMAMSLKAQEHTANSNGVNCKDIWMSEIYRKDVTVSGKDYGDYAIELFNPTTAAISLTNYKLTFTKANAGIVNVTFPTGSSIPAKGTYVIMNKNAETTLLALSDYNTNLLDFNQYVEVQLIKTLGANSTVIDDFGQATTQQQMTFAYMQFMANPTYYTTTYGFQINQLGNIDLRRGYFVQQGSSVFNPTQVFGTWAFYLGSNTTGLNNHKCMCNRALDDQPVCGYSLPLAVTLNKLPAFGQTSDALGLNWSSIGGNSFVLDNSFTSGTAVTGTDIDYTGPNQCTNAQINLNCVGVQCSGFGSTYVGTKNKDITLSSPFSDFTPDPASLTKMFTINGNKPVGIQEYGGEILNIVIYPTITSDFLNVKGNIGSNYSISSVDGKIVQTEAIYSETTIDVSSLSAGVYTILFSNYIGKKVDKFIKQ